VSWKPPETQGLGGPSRFVDVGEPGHPPVVQGNRPSGGLHHGEVHVLPDRECVAPLGVGPDHIQPIGHEYFRHPWLTLLADSVPVPVMEDGSHNLPPGGRLCLEEVGNGKPCKKEGEEQGTGDEAPGGPGGELGGCRHDPGSPRPVTDFRGPRTRTGNRCATSRPALREIGRGPRLPSPPFSRLPASPPPTAPPPSGPPPAGPSNHPQLLPSCDSPSPSGPRSFRGVEIHPGGPMPSSGGPRRGDPDGSGMADRCR
jgi:hypothetical protein